jgi:hypothetical protein
LKTLEKGMEKGENMRANIYDDVIENFDAKNSEK